LAGTWAAILTGLQALDAEAEWIDWTVSVDSTINRAHQHAAGARRDPDAQLNPPIGEPIALGIRNRYAALHAARLQPGRTVELPEAPYLHLFVPRGAVTLEGAGELGTGDAVRFTAPAVSGSPPPRPPRSSCGRRT
jgi:hypothetical protein